MPWKKGEKRTKTGSGPSTVQAPTGVVQQLSSLQGKGGDSTTQGQKQTTGDQSDVEIVNVTPEPTKTADDKSKAKLNKHKGGKLKQLVDHANKPGMDAPKPVKAEPGKLKKFGKKVIEKGGPVLETGKELADTGMDFAGEINDELKGLGIAGVVSSAIDTIKDCVGWVLDLKDLIKNKDKASGMKLIESTIGLIQSGCETAISAVGEFCKFTKAVPIIGSILGAIGTILEFIPHVTAVFRANKGRKNMKEQRKAEKQSLLAEHGSDGYVEDKKAKWYQRSSSVAGKKTVNKQKAAERREKLQQEVKILSRIGSRTPEQEAELKAKQEELDHLNEYFLTSEIKSADEKRIKQGAFDITGDVLGLVSALAGFGGPIGSAVGLALDVGVTAGKLGQKAARGIRQKWRDRDGGSKNGGFLGKSTKAKEGRRGQLGEYMVQKIVDLKNLDIENVDPEKAPATQVQDVNNQYGSIEKQIHGMNVFYSVLMRTKNHEEMSEKFAAGMSREGDSDSERGLITGFMEM